MRRVYALSAKGQQERSAQNPTLPAELGALLRLVDGHRTGTDLLAAAADRSAVTAGGLRWLKASGYLVATREADGVAGAITAGDAANEPVRHSTLSGASDTGARDSRLDGRASVVTDSRTAEPPLDSRADEARLSQAAQPSTLQPSGPQPLRATSGRSEGDTCRILSDFMVQTIRRRLGEAGYPHRRQIERATSVHELLPHLNPLIDAIVVRAGSNAGAEFADTAAFILKPRDRDATLR